MLSYLIPNDQNPPGNQQQPQQTTGTNTTTGEPNGPRWRA